MCICVINMFFVLLVSDSVLILGFGLGLGTECLFRVFLSMEVIVKAANGGLGEGKEGVDLFRVYVVIKPCLCVLDAHAKRN